VPGVLWIDSIIGEWYTFLSKSKELDDTLIVFSADHGNIAKGHCFEPSMRVPLLFHWPRGVYSSGKGKGGVVVDAVTSNIDIAPTLLDAAGIDASWLRQGGKRIVDGRSLLPLVSPNHAHYAPAREVHPTGIFCEIYSDRSVVGPNYTLVDLSRTHYDEAPYNRKPWGDKVQLYRSGDTEQRVNLVAKAARHEDPAAGKALQELTQRLNSHITDTIPKCQIHFWPEGFPTKLTNTLNAVQTHRGDRRLGYGGLPGTGGGAPGRSEADGTDASDSSDANSEGRRRGDVGDKAKDEAKGTSFGSRGFMQRAAYGLRAASNE